jgi:hypothetical protein
MWSVPRSYLEDNWGDTVSILKEWKNIRGLKLGVVKLTTVQVTKMPL